VKIAHRYGLVVEAYISHSKDKYHYFGLPADTPADVSKATKRMESIGVDLIGIMSGQTYVGLQGHSISPDVKDRINALVDTATVPTFIEGGMTMDTYKEFKDTGIQVVVIWTAFKEMAMKTVEDAAKQIIAYKPKR
jgi:pentose-5-phosphate-3-epimerase